MKQLESIRIILDHVNEKRIEQIRNEVMQKETHLISRLNDVNCPFDVPHREMVCEVIRDKKNPAHPETINKLMLQLISSAFSYNRIRKQFRKINREQFANPGYSILEDHQKILAFILGDNRLEEEEFWHPEKLESLISEIERKGEYLHRHIMTDYWLEHIMAVLRTAPKKLAEITNLDIEVFYSKADNICKHKPGEDIFKKSDELWEFATEMSKGIKNVGTNLMCDFLKQSGFTEYAKMDIHLLRSMTEILNVNSCTKLSDFQLFVATRWVAYKLEMAPYKLDKILYVYGVYYS